MRKKKKGIESTTTVVTQRKGASYRPGKKPVRLMVAAGRSGRRRRGSGR